MNRSTTVNKLAQILSWIVGLVLVLIPFHAFFTVWLGSNFGYYTALRLWKEFLLVLIALGALVLLLRDKKMAKQLGSYWLVRIIGIYIVVTLVWGIVSYELDKVSLKALGYGYIVNLRYLIFFVATLVIATKSHWLKKVWLKLVLIPAAVVSVVGIIQRLLLPYDVLKHFGYGQSTIFPYETINHNIRYPRVMSTLRGANPLGAYLLLITNVIAAKFIEQKSKRWMWGLFGFACTVTLILSYSRGAWLGFVVSISALLWASLKSGRAKRALEICALLVLILGSLLLVSLHNNPTFQNVFFHTQTNSISNVSSNAGHASALRSGLHDAIHEPLGRGPGTAGSASVYNHHQARISENYYIQIMQEVGWIGLALFVAINYFVAKELWKRRSNILALALFSSLLGLIVVNMFTHAWSDDTLAYLWWGLAGVAIAA